MEPDEISQFVKDQLALAKESGSGKSGTGLAEVLGINKSGVSRIKSGERSEYTAREIETIKEYFLGPPSPLTPVTSGNAGTIKVAGRIGENWHRDEDPLSSVSVFGVIDDDYAISEQFAYEIDMHSPDREFMQGDYVIGAPFPNDIQSRPMVGDTIIVKRTSVSLRGWQSITIKRAVLTTGAGVQLQSIYPETSLPADMVETAIGIVISTQRKYRRNRS